MKANTALAFIRAGLSLLMLASMAILAAVVWRNASPLSWLEGKRERTEAALRQSEECVRMLIEHAPAAIAIFDREMRYLAVSRRWLTDYHLDNQDIIGQSHYQVFPEISDAWKAVHQRSLGGEVLRASEDRFERADGTVQWLRWEVLPWRRADGEIGGITIFTEDITERKRAEEAAQESEERFHLMADAAPVLLWMSDTDALCTFFNKPWLNFRGRTMEQELGNGWVEGVHPDDLSRCLDTYRSAFAARRTFTMEYRLRRADGEYRWVLDNGTPRFAPDASFAGYIGSCLDITERKHVEGERERLIQELEESRSRLAAIIGSATDAILTIDEQQRIVVFNDAAEQVFGCSATEVLGQPIDRLIPERFRAVHRHHIHSFGRTGVTGRSMSSPGMLAALRADGEEFPIEASISQARVGDQQLYTVILRDLSEHRRMERALQREQRIAGLLQQAFSPQNLPECPGYRFGAVYRPALKEAEIGGDFYDAFPLPGGRLGLLLGDVSGKGLAAAVCATMTHYMVRAYALETHSPADVLARTNHALCESLDDPGLFVTAVYAVLDPATGSLRSANAGHWPPLVTRASGTKQLEGRSVPLGVVPETAYLEQQLQLERGDRLVIFTDGLVETNRQDPMLNLEALQEVLIRERDVPPDQMVERLHQHALRRSHGALRDDVAILALSCDDVPCPVAPRAVRIGAGEPASPLVGTPQTLLPQMAADPEASRSSAGAEAEQKVTLELEGDIDVSTVSEFETRLRQLTKERPKVLVLDLEQVTFLDSAGVRLILQAYRYQQAAGNTLEVVAGRGVAREVLRHCRLTSLLPP
jgi:anti-anti-sigma factor